MQAGADAKRDDGRGFHAGYNGIGTIVVAMAWLALYVVAALGADAAQMHRDGASLDVFRMHLNIGILPIQKFHDRSVVFASDDST